MNGALKDWVPPQEFVIVNVPELGGFVKVTTPESEYWLFKHALGTAVTLWMEHGEGQGAGAIKLVLAVQLIFAEKVAETVQIPPLAAKPEME